MYQQIILIGNLGNDPESRKTPGGQQVASFRMATNKSWTDAATGEKRDKSTWFRISAWGKLAEIASLYATKGRQVMVIGEIEDANPYLDKTGKPAATLEVTARTIKLLGGRGAEDDEAPAQRTERQTAQPTKRAPEPDDNEIPF